MKFKEKGKIKVFFLNSKSLMIDRKKFKAALDISRSARHPIHVNLLPNCNRLPGDSSHHPISRSSPSERRTHTRARGLGYLFRRAGAHSEYWCTRTPKIANTCVCPHRKVGLRGVFHTASDASRNGAPAEDTSVLNGWEPKSHVGGYLALQVLRTILV